MPYAALVQLAVDRLVMGFTYEGPPGARLAHDQGQYADDSSAGDDAACGIRLYFEALYVTALVLRLLPSVDPVKKNKAAWSGGAYLDGVWMEDTETMITVPIGPDGEDVTIPRCAAYRLLGCLVSPDGDLGPARLQLEGRVRDALSVLGQLGGLTPKVIRDTVLVVYNAFFGYYAAPIPLGEEACASIDVFLLEQLSLLGHHWKPSGAPAMVFVPCSAGGGGFPRAHDIARAAFMRLFGRHCPALPSGAPAAFAFESEVALTAVRLSWEPSEREPTPVEFYPLELHQELTEGLLGEAFLRYSMDAGVRHMHSGAASTGALQRPSLTLIRKGLSKADP